MKKEKHFRTVRPYLAMIIAVAMVMTSFSTPTMTYAEENNQAEACEVEETSVEETEVEEIEAEETDTEETDTEEADTEETDAEEIEEEEITETDWTIYMYICGSNLESDGGYASNNLEDLINASGSSRVRYIIETGGAGSWTNEQIDGDRSQRFLIQNGRMEKVYDEPAYNMADHGRLSDFIKWGHENYPAEKTMLCFWNHGGAIMGVCWSDQYNDHLSVPDIANELYESGEYFDIIGFDACLMADFDVLCALSPYADYIVASEETEPGCGWNYGGCVSYLESNPTCKPEQFASKACDLYIDNLFAEGETSSSTLSVVKTDALIDVKAAVDHMMSAVSEKITDYDALNAILSLGYNSKQYSYPYEKDLVSLAKQLSLVLGEDIEYEVREAVEAAVIHRAQLNEGSYNNGISMFWAPQANANLLTQYQEFAVSDEYLRVIDAIYHDWHAPARVYDGHDRLPEIDPYKYKLAYELKPGYGAVSPLMVTNAIDTINSITYSISTDTEDGYIIRIAEKGNLNVTVGNTFTPAFDGKIATIDGIPIVMSVVSETEEFSLFEVPINIYGYDCKMRVAYYPAQGGDSDTTDRWVGDYGTEDDGVYQILGVYNNGNSASGYAARDTFSLDNGLEVTVTYPELNEMGYEYFRKGESFIYSAKNTAIEMSNLDDGDYYITYNIKTTMGEKYSTDPQPITCNNGTFLKRAATAAATAAAPATAAENAKVHIPCVSYDKYYAGKTDAASEEETEPAADKVTVLMYLDGCNLENTGYSTGLINSMVNAKKADGVNLILETGGCDNWHNDAIKNDAIQRFEVHEGTLVEVESLERANFGAGYTLSDFLKWGAENYPAEKYIFITYDHGGAWTGNSQDDIYGGSTISLNEITAALENSGVHFDLVYFDCCLMASAEVCAAIAPYADYMIASEESLYVTPEIDQSETFSYIARHADDLDIEKYGKYVVNKHADNLGDFLTGYALSDYQQLSFIDLSKMDGVVDAVNRLGVAMCELKDDPAKMTILTNGLDLSRRFSFTFQRDIVDFATNAYGIDNDVINDVINSVNDAVIFSRAINDYDRSSGMTICYPREKGGSFYDLYASVCPFKDYLAFIDSITYGWHALPGVFDNEDSENVNSYDYKIDSEIESIDEKTAVLKINSDMNIVNGMYYTISEIDPDGYRFYDLCRLGDFVQNGDNENRFAAGFDGRVLTIDGVKCYTEVYSESEDSVILSIPAKSSDVMLKILIECVEEADEEAPEADEASENIEVAERKMLGNVSYDKCQFNFIGVVVDNDLVTGLPERDVVTLAEGDELTLLEYQSDSFGNVIYTREGETITYSPDMSIRFENLPDGEYRLGYEVLDGLMKLNHAGDVDVVIENGRIQQMIVPEKEEEEPDETEQILSSINKDELRYCVEEEEAPVVYFMAGADYEDAKTLADNKINVTRFDIDRNFGFFGSVAAFCIDYDQLFEDAQNDEEYETYDYVDEDDDDDDDDDDEDEDDDDEDDDDDVDEDVDEDDIYGHIYVNYLEGIGLLTSEDPVALDQASIDIMSRFEQGQELMYSIAECHGLDLLIDAEEMGIGMRNYILEYLPRDAE